MKSNSGVGRFAHKPKQRPNAASGATDCRPTGVAHWQFFAHLTLVSTMNMRDKQSRCERKQEKITKAQRQNHKTDFKWRSSGQKGDYRQGHEEFTIFFCLILKLHLL